MLFKYKWTVGWLLCQIYKSLELNCMTLWTINYDDKVYWNLSQLSKTLETVSLCIWGWPRPHLHNEWHQSMYCHFWLDPGWARPFWECACVTQIKWRYHALWGNLGVLTWDVQDRLKEISWCWCVTCTEYGSRLSPINTPWIYQLKELLVSHSTSCCL